ncbi:PAS domain-containing sensor histidine kinase [Thioclava sediminum]|uniref:histidine kinase n=1 Tax=Thioclava sediminum TaxID=1915319 RepID=A0ABX3MVE6_9RHOB|nr:MULTISPECIES: PAS domain-containing sensor histidine kinase [unclassified Thioclava]OOY16092.1 PAS domain-containing sensor histidine kinase [Thioclava sp. DLFJ4-1]OOY23601.1 PAS domain-containing sensor histidine kinase [Thioclava sediminum]OOY30583.1 PAS domain-containing sensor histidine kinase [Thioclava sp. F36-6]
MQGSTAYRSGWDRLARFRRQKRVRNLFTFGLVVLGPALAIATFIVLGPLGQGADSTALRLILLADFVYFLLLAGLILMRLVQIIAARRAHSAGSRLTLRLTGVFAGIALVPTILVAVFAFLTVNIGLEGWFSDRVRSVVGTSLQAAEAYQSEHKRDLVQDSRALANFLNLRRQASTFMSDGELRELLITGQAGIQRGVKEAYVIDGTGRIVARGDRSYLFDYEEPSPRDIVEAQKGETVLIEDWPNSELRALIRLDAFVDRYLYISRKVDGQILALLDKTRETVTLYQQLESARGRVIFEFGLLYFGFALILILAALWMGLWFAERLSRPIGRLAAAAERVGSGDLDARVIEAEGDDEIATLGEAFNRMTGQLKGQRMALIENHRETEERRRMFDSVLSSVTSGVIGLDADGRIDFVNRAAMTLLALDSARDNARELSTAVPEFVGLYNRLQDGLNEVAQEEIRVSRGGRLESLLVRMAVRRNDLGTPEGYVVAFEDVTDLVSAQRMAAWGDVARRIAHEIKNPLTPIQLSAERIKRKFGKMTEGEDLETLNQLTGVIVRQTNDLRRIVDEFSRFARMPEPDRADHDLAQLVRDAATLQQDSLHGAKLVTDVPSEPVIVELDATMISQAVTNLVKNAGEAIESYTEKGNVEEGFAPEVRLDMQVAPEHVTIHIADNGIGLPPDRSRLFEPYVTTREKGTGLGLPIVKKIIEEHGGTLTLSDAPAFAEGAHRGALAEIRLPRARAALRAIKERGEAPGEVT